ncbi:MAG TPA: hypothetical protein VF614_13155 [Chthoniobacteraceae bacterium]|jgi:hypothetical protein
MHSIVSAIFHLIARLIVSVLFWLALFPIAVVVATPFILLFACWDASPYFTAVQARYSGFYEWWLDAIPTLSVDWS